VLFSVLGLSYMLEKNIISTKSNQNSFNEKSSKQPKGYKQTEKKSVHADLNWPFFFLLRPDNCVLFFFFFFQC
jgi:hypothetical protein